MNPLISFIQQMIIGKITDKTPDHRFSSAGIALKGLSCALLLVGLFLALYAEYIWLGIFLPLYLATLITAVTIIVLAIIAAVWGDSLQKKQPEPQRTPIDITAFLTDILSSLDNDLDGSIRTNPKIAVLLSTLGGFMAGKKLDS